MTGLESRVTILGHLQRGGTPSAADRLLATHLGTACTDLIAQGTFGVMVASQGGEAVPVPLEQVAGNKKTGASGSLFGDQCQAGGYQFRRLIHGRGRSQTVIQR